MHPDDTVDLFVLASTVLACTMRMSRLPDRGETITAGPFRMEPGGKGLNVAVGALRLGATVDGIVPLGRDLAGDITAGMLGAHGVPPGMVLRLPGTTGAGIGLIEADGENRIAITPGANAALDPAAIAARAADIARARVTVAQFEIGLPAVLRAFGIARDAGRRTILNPSPFVPVPAALLAHSDVVVMNRVEADLIARQFGTDAVSAILSHGPQACVVTAGARGAQVHLRDGTTLDHPGFGITVRDTIGAGDGFLAGLATGLARDAGWPAILRTACACGAIVASRDGVIDALPSATEVTAFLARAEKLAAN